MLVRLYGDVGDMVGEMVGEMVWLHDMVTYGMAKWYGYKVWWNGMAKWDGHMGDMVGDMVGWNGVITWYGATYGDIV